MTTELLTRLGVRVVWAAAVDTAADRLDPAERERLRGLGEASRPGFLAGRALLRRLLDEAGDAGPLETRCPTCGRAHGAPRSGSGATLLGLAHAGDLVVGVSAPASRVRALGVDVEIDDTATRRRVREAAPLLPPRTIADVAAWTRIEAALKADGRGVVVAPAAVRWRDDPDGTSWAHLPGREQPLRVETTAGPEGSIVSVAVDPVG